MQTFERSAALQRVECLRSYLSGGEISENLFHNERNSFEEHRDALLHLAQRQKTLYSLPQQKLPDIKCQYITMNVSTVIDVNHFWGQYIDRQTSMSMKQINEILAKELTLLSSTSIETGMMCAAPFLLDSPRTTTPNNNQQLAQRYQYYRARILRRIDNVTVEVFFIDWGNTEQVSIDQCKRFSSVLHQFFHLI